MPGGIGGEEEEDLLIEVNQWVVDQNLPEGEFLFELTDPATGDALTASSTWHGRMECRRD